MPTTTTITLATQLLVAGLLVAGLLVACSCSSGGGGDSQSSGVPLATLEGSWEGGLDTVGARWPGPRKVRVTITDVREPFESPPVADVVVEFLERSFQGEASWRFDDAHWHDDTNGVTHVAGAVKDKFGGQQRIELTWDGLASPNALTVDAFEVTVGSVSGQWASVGLGLDRAPSWREP